jgi:hypothetical protein
MRTTNLFLAWAALVTSLATAQPSPNPQPPAQVQAQPVPCVTSAPQNPSGNQTVTQASTKLQRFLDKQLQAKTGISVADLASATQTPTPKAVPCPTQTATSKIPPTPQPQPLKLPPDTTTTLHCDPRVPKVVSEYPITLSLPDPHAYAVPKPGQFEWDSVLPDLAAKTPCWSISVDPKTNKSFINQ